MYIRHTNSTNTYLRDLIQSGQKEPYIWTDFQSAGRGQAGNGWESADGENILLSLWLDHPRVKPADQWRISMLFSLVVVETIETYFDSESRARLTIKWPNDIYWDNEKLAGILIEHVLDAEGINCSILGIGLNVNQTEWPATVPNPTSLRRITGREWNRVALLEHVLANWEKALPRLSDKSLAEAYMCRLYRKDGYYPYVQRAVSTEPTTNASPEVENQFWAAIETITPQGELVLRDEKGNLQTYHFKQLRYVL